MSFRLARDLNLAVGAKALSLFGDEVATFALVLRVKSHGAGAVSAMLMANLVPIVLVSPVAGRLADRVDRRRLLVLSGLAQVGVCAVLAFVTAPPALLTLVAVLGVGQAVNAATWQALLPSLVAPGEAARALARSQAVSTVGLIAAPAVAGLLTGTFGTRIPVLIDAVTFVAVAGCALALRRRGVGALVGGGPFTGLQRRRGGVAIVRGDPALRAAILLLGAAVLLGSVVNVADVFLVRDALHATVFWFGACGAAYAIGMLAGAVVAGRLAGHRRALVYSAVVLTIGLLFMGLAPSVGWLLGIGAVTGCANGVLNVATSALIVGRAAPAERGRVAAVVGAVVAAGQLVAYAAGGVLTSAVGPRTVFVLAGAVGLAAPVFLGGAVLRTGGRRRPPPGRGGGGTGAADAVRRLTAVSPALRG